MNRRKQKFTTAKLYEKCDEIVLTSLGFIKTMNFDPQMFLNF